MLIAENYLLVTLEETSEKKYISFINSKTLCLAGAWVMELILKRKLLIEGKYLLVIDTNSTGDEYLDEILTFIKDSKKTRRLRSWVRILSSKYIIETYSLVFKRLESQGILEFEKRKKKVFTKMGYVLFRPEVKQSILERIHKIIIDNLEPDIELLCLLSLIKYSKLIKVLIPKEYRKVAKRRIDELVRFGRYDPSHLEMISKILKAFKDISKGKNFAIF